MTTDDDGSSVYKADADDAPSTDVADAAKPRRQLNVLWCFVIGVIAALIGMLPWLVTGMRLPLEKLWGNSASAAATPEAVLPFSQSMLTLIIGLIVTGSAIAGVAARATRARHARHGLRAVVLGVIFVQIIVAAQATAVVMNGLEGSTWAGGYLASMIAVTVVSVLIGILVLLLIASSPVPGAMIGLSVAAIGAGIWVNALVAPFGIIPDEATSSRLYNVQWIPALIVGVASAWGGFRTVGRVSAAVAALLILWIAPAVLVVVRAVTGLGGHEDVPGGMLAYLVDTLRMALLLPALLPLMVAVIVAALGSLIRSPIRSRPNAAPLAAAGPW
ncbi:hypothetical protein [Diaminobutyricimonas sp. TR449]|uniref:hypothetical protein n=1 Tax=Diaminobutyricimonas sp. TR449 TaxID=2708076 RepID=UPI00141F9F6D|nr:hypothetical protein [Diaminobutyricimonas sp. TR449]